MGLLKRINQENLLLKIKSSPDSSPIPSPSIISSSSRKRRRRNSPSSNPPSQIPVLSSLPKTNHRLSIAVIPPSVDINNPQKGDIIDMENGSRKKFDGVVWRKICSIPDCLIAAQRNELCRKHFIKLNGKPNNGSNDIIGSVTMVPPVPKSIASMSTSSADEKSGRDILILTLIIKIYLYTSLFCIFSCSLMSGSYIL